MTDPTLTQIQTHIEEIEKRIKSLSIAFTSSTQYAALKVILEELKEVLVAYNKEFDTFVTEISASDKSQNEEIETIKTRLDQMTTILDALSEKVDTLQSEDNSQTDQEIAAIKTDVEALNSSISSMAPKVAKISSMESTVSSIQSSITNINTNLDTISEKIDALEKDQGSSVSSGSSGSSCNCTETLNWHARYRQNIYTRKINVFTSGPVYFRCDPTEEVRIVAKIRGNAPTAGSNCYKSLVLDGQEQTRIQYPYEIEVSQTIELTFFPTKEIYQIQTRACASSTSGTVNYYYVDYEIYGRNVCVYNKCDELKILNFNNTCYITKPSADGTVLLEQTADELNLSAEGTIYTKQTGTYYDEQLFPKIAVSTSDSKKVSLDSGYIYTIINDTRMFNGKITDTGAFSSGTSLQYPIFQKQATNTPRGGTFFEHCIVTTTNVPYITGSGLNNENAKPPSGFSRFKYNGDFLSEIYDFVGAMDNSKGDNSSNQDDWQYVAMDKNFFQTFYPKYNADYCVEIGYGSNATMFKQPDGSINLYLKRFGAVYKYVLALNQEGKYAVTKKSKFPGLTRIFETYGEKAIVRKTDSSYAVVLISSLTEEDVEE